MWHYKLWLASIGNYHPWHFNVAIYVVGYNKTLKCDYFVVRLLVYH